MGTTKSEEFSVRDNRIADFAKALAHPARIAILRVLAEREKCVCGDFVEEIPLSQSTVSQHLKELKSAGLIKGEIEGSKICYCIDAENWKKMNKTFKKFFKTFDPD
ncbi:MAG: winged helix-turn-helix transcriptional regulator [Sphingomonadales bacterium]|nr:winged helix-turn-helix transcriptional regulator [Sphingomonadales bacterium]